MERTFETDRLILRPFAPADAGAVQAFCSDREVARMTSRIPHPYPEVAAAAWIASHAEAADRGEEFDFCIAREDTVVGTTGLLRKADRIYELGYWLGKPYWGRGYATEAARCLAGFAFRELGAVRLTAGHYLDNPASGRVLEKCGFAYTGETGEWSEARGREVRCRRMALERADMVEQNAAS